METVVNVEDLRKAFGSVHALRGLSFAVSAGEVYGIVGPNGAGKSTALRVLLGLVRPTGGQVTVLGHRPGSPGMLARVGALIETPAFYPYLSGRQNLRVLARVAGVPLRDAEPLLETVGLRRRAGDRVGTYSLGMTQRLGIAAALLKRPELLVLDEPTNGLDPAGIEEVRALVRRLREQGTTVLFSSHQLHDIEALSDRLVIIRGGAALFEGPPADLLAGSTLLVRASPADRAADLARDLLGDGAVAVRDGALHVGVDSAGSGRLNRRLVEAGLEVTELRPLRPTLEEVFFRLTGDGEHAGGEPAAPA